MMFDRLVESIVASADAAHFSRDKTREVQLAAAMALVATMSADYVNKPEEARAVIKSLADLFNLDRRKCLKLLSRAMAARARDPSLFNSAMLLKRFGTEELNRKILAAATHVAKADGELHDYEADLLQRLQRMLAPKVFAS
jgi:uncharacterized tellurite resistance protein B-like protein